ncbi:hypothetical protein [Lutispora thermophila]|uniref:Uncharacterized protein n=1 Tax=Lutispora thermophila DSM 19022 TaxID=1122184 RepID=A0A1M6HWL7_9FIRM|nr:hypothetical protein [Lutispora thermophila]SHJ26611.1 hypothetical protein SAMN02745176_02974 [Lutispora thermophila DSM 19022]
MYFTEGRLRTYERMMQEKPKHDSEPVKPVREEDCAQCRYFDKHSGKCSKEKCVIPDD